VVCYPEILGQILQGKPVSLAAWTAEPVEPVAALEALPGIQKQLRRSRPGEKSVFPLRLGEIILRFWAGQDIDAAYQNLSAVLDELHQRALLELCIGQLLMARRSLQAWSHLDRGFQLAAHLLEPEDYFLVLKRHELLRQLPSGLGDSGAAGLEALLKEAAVIERLKGHGTHSGYTGPKHQDTVD